MKSNNDHKIHWYQWQVIMLCVFNVLFHNDGSNHSSQIELRASNKQFVIPVNCEWISWSVNQSIITLVSQPYLNTTGYEAWSAWSAHMSSYQKQTNWSNDKSVSSHKVLPVLYLPQNKNTEYNYAPSGLTSHVCHWPIGLQLLYKILL